MAGSTTCAIVHTVASENIERMRAMCDAVRIARDLGSGYDEQDLDHVKLLADMCIALFAKWCVRHDNQSPDEQRRAMHTLIAKLDDIIARDTARLNVNA